MLSDNADRVKEAITMREVVTAYGYEVNRGGYIYCPFHSEKTPSCMVYEKNIHCFGCGVNADAISFVRRLFGLNFKEAIAKLNDDFNLELDLSYDSSPEAKQEATKRAKEHKRKQQEKIQRDKALIAKCKLYRSYLYALDELKPPTEYDFLHPDFVYALHNVERLGYELDNEIGRNSNK